ncbi:MAG: alpha/beta fold hydrolase [Anaerolineales bacterium]
MWDTYSGRDLLEDHPPSGRYPLPELDAVRRWPVPALFVTGEGEEAFTSLVADSLARWMPNARRVIIPGGGHGVHFQQPDRFNAALASFLDEIARSRRRP